MLYVRPPDVGSSVCAYSSDDEIYEIVALELEQGTFRKGQWTRLFAEADGDREKTKVAYIRERVSTLMEERRSAIEAEQRHTVAIEEQKRTEAEMDNNENLRNAERALLWGCSDEEAGQSFAFAIIEIRTAPIPTKLTTM